MPTNKNPFDESILYPSTKKQEKKKNKRVFRAIFENPDGLIILDGKYHGTKPRQAASKAFTKILQIFLKADKELTTQIYFGLKECTRKKKSKNPLKEGAQKKTNKCYWYTGIKKKLSSPTQSRIKKDLSTGTPYINPDTGKPVIDPVSGKEVIDPKTCEPMLDSSGNPIIIYHNFTNTVKKSKIIFCKHLLNYDQNEIDDDDDDNKSDSSSSDDEEIEPVVIKKKQQPEIEKKPTKKKPTKK